MKPKYILLPVFTILFLLLTLWVFRDGLPEGPAEADYSREEQALRAMQRIEWNGETYLPRRNLDTFLLLGIDRGEGRRVAEGVGGQADVLLLFVLDHGRECWHILQINRDTMTQIPVMTDGQIFGEDFGPVCLSHAYGTGGEDSCENTVRAVEYLLSGVKIDGYAAVDMDSIGFLNDLVGGVDVTIDRDMTAADPAFEKGASVHLDGKKAEAFLRARMSLGDTDNSARMSRQKQYMDGWVAKAKKLLHGDSEAILDFVRKTESQLTTDVSEKRMCASAEDALRFENGGIVTFAGENRSNGSFNCFYVDEESAAQLITELFYEKEN